jgi:hypothetical protein
MRVPSPPQAVPEERNEWLEHDITDLYARFALSCHHHHHREKLIAGGDGEEEEDEDEADGAAESVENRLLEFVRAHATAGAGGYGGWKTAYRRFVSA